MTAPSFVVFLVAVTSMSNWNRIGFVRHRGRNMRVEE